MTSLAKTHRSSRARARRSLLVFDGAERWTKTLHPLKRLALQISQTTGGNGFVAGIHDVWKCRDNAIALNRGMLSKRRRQQIGNRELAVRQTDDAFVVAVDNRQPRWLPCIPVAIAGPALANPYPEALQYFFFFTGFGVGVGVGSTSLFTMESARSWIFWTSDPFWPCGLPGIGVGVAWFQPTALFTRSTISSNVDFFLSGMTHSFLFS